MRLCNKVVVGALLAFGLVMACSPSDFVDYDDVLGIDDGAGAGEKKIVKVDGTSEARLILKTGASLTIPKGAVDRNIDISIERPEDDKAIGFVKALPTIKSAASAPYILTPHGTKFIDRVTLELPVAEKHQDRQLVAAYLEDEEDRDWKVLAIPKVAEGKAVVELGHFSVVILLDADTAGLGALPDSSVRTEPADGGVVADAAGASTTLDAEARVDPNPVEYADAGSAPVDAGSKLEDAAVPVRPPDSGVAEAGVPFDAGPLDAGPLDAGTPDAALPPNAAAPLDAGAPPPDAARAG